MKKISKLTDKSVKRLKKFLISPDRPEGTLNYYELAGFLFTIASSPEFVQPSEWLPLIFNDQDAEYESLEEAQNIVQDVMGLFNCISESAGKKGKLPMGCEPDKDAMANLKVNAPLSLWAQGFIIGHEWLQECWTEYLPESMDEELGEIMLILSFFASENLAKSLVEKSEDQETSLDKVAISILDLFPGAVELYSSIGQTIFRTVQNLSSKKGKTASTLKIGRNEPCPCGSGKKFKKCCLGKEPTLH
ncbi:MAG: UPF0149 family protein [Deltaproteobacteria bacterium]|nr:UPF0149 family protein [Deltaproteobacteria bacterium]